MKARAKRKKPRNPQAQPDYVIFADIYGVQVGVFRTKQKLDGWLTERGLPIDNVPHQACARRSADPQGVEWFTAFIPPKCPPAIVCHEAVHLAWFILDNKGVEVDAGNHEAMAYLVEHLTEQMLSRR